VLIGLYDGAPALNPEEALNWKFMTLDAIQKDVSINPQHYTQWFKIILEQPQLNKLQIA
jgi:isopentenyl-diphosphate delta-isomerase